MGKRMILTSSIILTLFVAQAIGKSFTLSDAGLISLDWYNDILCDPCNTASVAERRDIPGPGVEFDIHFPSNKSPDTILELVSARDLWGRSSGEGLLAGIDISDYDAFELKFTLVSINGKSSSEDEKRPLVVGAVINIIVDKKPTWAFRPEIISFAPWAQKTAISRTTTDANEISVVGFTTYIPDWWWKEDPNSNPWDPAGSTVTLLIEPAPDADAIPKER